MRGRVIVIIVTILVIGSQQFSHSQSKIESIDNRTFSIATSSDISLFTISQKPSSLILSGAKEDIKKWYPKVCLSNGKCIEIEKVYELIEREGK